MCVWERRNAQEFWTGPKAGWNWLYPLTAQEAFFLHMQKGTEQYYFFRNSPATMEIARIRSNQSVIQEWDGNKEPLFIQNKTPVKGKKLGKGNSELCSEPYVSNHHVCCRNYQTCKNSGLAMVVLISEALTVAAVWLCFFLFKSTGWKKSFNKKLFQHMKRFRDSFYLHAIKTIYTIANLLAN